MARKIYFDTETTGFKPGQIGQLSMIIDEDGKISARNYFFKIKYINEDAEKLLNRGVDFYEKVSNGIEFKDKALELKEIFDGAIFAAHNLAFDENFLSTELWRCGLIAKPSGRFDTMLYYKDKLGILDKHGKVKNPKLVELVTHLGIDEDKLENYCKQLFNCEDATFHDARLDSTVVFVVSQIARELNEGINDGPWYKTFVNN